MKRADKAVLRLTIGLGLAVLIAYGLALPIPFVVCVMSVLVLCKPGPPIPLVKGAVIALIFAALVAAGVLMVPLLENYALTGILLTATILYGVFFLGLRHSNPLTMVLVIIICPDPGRRCRRSGHRGHAERDARRRHPHRHPGQRLVERLLSRSASPGGEAARRRRLRAARRPAGSPCAPR